MPSGAARIDDASTIAELRRRGARGKPLPAGMLGALTVVCWAVWIYLVLPLLSLRRRFGLSAVTPRVHYVLVIGSEANR